MARDATQIPAVNRDAVLNYTPAAAQAFLDNGIVAVHLKLPFNFQTADAAALCTVPTGSRAFQVLSGFVEVTQTFTTATAGACGISSDDTNFSTKGDILGGTAGMLVAFLVSTGATYKTGLVGTKFGAVAAASAGAVTAGTHAPVQAIYIPAGKIIRYDQIAGTYTAGAGFIHLTGFLID
jgi:hypothetical protein